MAAWLDMAGTMIITAFLFILGPRGLFIEFRGGAALVLIFCMIWLGKWHRRSGCMTLAEWMKFRFGQDPGAHISRIVSAISQLIFCVGILAYAIVGAGLFLSTFFPFPPWICALVLVIVTTIYTIEAGFFGVVVTDIFQMLLVLIGVVSVTALAVWKMNESGNFAEIAVEVSGNSQWFSSIPHMDTKMPDGYKEYSALFSITMFFLLKTVIQGLGFGYEPKYFAARNDRECGLLSFLIGWLMSIRWLLMMAFVILGIYLVKDWFPDQQILTDATAVIKIHYPDIEQQQWAGTLTDIANQSATVPADLLATLKSQLGDNWTAKLDILSFHGTANPEKILPVVLLNCIPPVLRSLLLVALLAAAMSTINAFLNMSTGYFTRDLYQAYVRPNAKNKELIYASYVFGVVLMVIEFLMAYSTKNINDLWGWIAMSLSGGLIVPLALRLYWWRFNGYGFSIGTFSGVIASIIQRFFWPDWPETTQFLFTVLIGLVASILGTLLTQPTQADVLKTYYQRVRPFGFWGKFKYTLSQEQQQATKEENRNDIIALPFAFFWQVSILLLPMQLLIGAYEAFFITLLILAVALIGLYKFWYTKLPKDNAVGLSDPDTR